MLDKLNMTMVGEILVDTDRLNEVIDYLNQDPKGSVVARSVSLDIIQYTFEPKLSRHHANIIFNEWADIYAPVAIDHA